MAFIGVKVPAEVGRMLESIDVPGERHSLSDMHVTLLYLGKGIDFISVAKTMVATHEVASRTRPFMAWGDTVSSFPSNPEDGIPVIVPVNSQPLHVFRTALANRFDELGIRYSKKYPDFKPHITLSYVKDPDPGFQVPSEPLPGYAGWVVYDVTIWAGDGSMSEGTEIRIPLRPGPGPLGLVEVASRIAKAAPHRL
jgi:2'-5' RNA ligase